MSHNEERILSSSGPIEVVADQTADGAYEIRLQARPDEDQDSAESTVLTADATATRLAAKRGRSVSTVAAAGAALAAVGLVALAVVLISGGRGGEEAPAIVEVPENSGFNGYIVQQPEFEPDLLQVTGEVDAGVVHEADGPGMDPEYRSEAAVAIEVADEPPVEAPQGAFAVDNEPAANDRGPNRASALSATRRVRSVEGPAVQRRISTSTVERMRALRIDDEDYEDDELAEVDEDEEFLDDNVEFLDEDGEYDEYDEDDDEYDEYE